MKTPELDRWMELNAAGDAAETLLLQRMLKFVTFGSQKPDTIQVKTVKDLRAAGLQQLDRALEEMERITDAPPHLSPRF